MLAHVRCCHWHLPGEQQHHDVRQHAGLGHEQHDDQDMNLEDMLPLRQAFNLDQEDAMLEDDNNQHREQVMSPIGGQNLYTNTA